MLCGLEDLKVYKKYCENVLDGNIVPFEEDVVEKLRKYKNKEDNSMRSYLNTILTYSNGSTSYLKSRYLAQFLPKGIKICDGNLDSFENKYPHSWIEDDKKVYDTIFVGIWPKELFYEIMKPTVINVVDLEKDEEYLRIKSKTIEIKEENAEFGYFDWYNYMKNNTINTRGFIEPLRLKKFKNE